MAGIPTGGDRFPHITPSVFIDLFTSAEDLSDLLGEDVLSAYLRAKLRIAEARRGIFAGSSGHVQRLYRILKQRLERQRERYEVVAHLLRTEAADEEFLREFRRLGLPLPKEGQDLRELARRYRQEAITHAGYLERRLRAIEQDLSRLGVVAGRNLEELEEFIASVERSKIFEVPLPGHRTVNKIHEAVVRRIEREIERIADIEDESTRLKELERLKDYLTGDLRLSEDATPAGSVSQTAKRLEREEYQFASEGEMRQAEIEEERLRDKAVRMRSRRRANTHERLLASIDRAISESAQAKAQKAASDLERYVGRFLYRVDESGVRRPLEVIGVDRSGPEPKLIVRPYALTLSTEATLHARLRPYSLIRYYETHLFPEAVRRRWQAVRRFDPYSVQAVATSIIYEVNERLERSRRYLQEIVDEQIENAKYRKALISFLKGGQRRTIAGDWNEIFNELIGTRFAISMRRLGLDSSLRIPYRMFRVLRQDFPFFMYGKDTDELLADMVSIASVKLRMSREFRREVERYLAAIQEAPDDVKLQREFEARLNRWVGAALRRARGEAFSNLLSEVAMEELGDAGRYVFPLQYLERALDERNIPAHQHWRVIEEIIDHYRRSGEAAPDVLRPLVEGPRQDVFAVWRALQSGAAKTPLSLDMPVGKEQDATLLSLLASGDKGGTVGAALRGDEGQFDDLLARISVEGGRKGLMPPEMRPEHRPIFERLLAAYEVAEGVEGLDPNASLERRALHIARGILGRELTPTEEEQVLRGGWTAILRLARAEETPQLYPVDIERAMEYERLGMVRPGNLYLRYQGKLIGARIAGLPDDQAPGLRVVIPSTGAEVLLSRTQDPLSAFRISLSELRDYELSDVHPVLGGARTPWTVSRSASLRPPVHPRLLAEMGYSAADVLQGAAVLRRGGVVGAVDVETTGLLEHYERLGLASRFYPTEMGIAQYAIRGAELEPVSRRRMIIRPSAEMEAWVREMAALSESEFIARHVQPGNNEALLAAKQIYQQTLRGYAALVQGPAVREADIPEPELRRLALEGLERAKRSGVRLSTAARHLRAMISDVAGRMGEAHLIAANAARAEAQWLPRWIGEIDTPVVFHDPQALFRMLFPGEERYNLGRISEVLGIRFRRGRLHTALYDAQLAAKAYAQMLADERLGRMIEQMGEESILRPGQILLRTEGGARTLYQVASISPSTGTEQAQVVLRSLLGRPRQLVISGANMGDVERRMFGRWTPVGAGEGRIGLLLQQGEAGLARVFGTPEEIRRIYQIQAEYWADRARRDIVRAFSNPRSELFPLFTMRPGTPEFTQALEKLRPAYAPEAGARIYRRTVAAFLSGMEGALHRRFFTSIQELMRAGAIDSGEAASLLKTYYNQLRERFDPRRILPARSSALRREIPHLGVRSIRLSSPEAVQRRLGDLAWELAQKQAGDLPARDYYPLAVQQIRYAFRDMVPEDADLARMAEAVYRQGHRLWRQGKVSVPDVTAGILPAAGRGAVIREIMRLQDELLAEQRIALEQIRRNPSGVYFLGYPAEEAFAIAEGRASPLLTRPDSKAVDRVRYSLWRDITQAAFDPSRGKAHELARSFMGLGSGDPGRIRLPFPVQGEYGVRLGDVTLEQWPEVKRRLRRSSGLEPNMRQRIMEFWAQRLGSYLRQRQTAQGLSALASQGRLAGPGPRGYMWAGLAGAAALGLYAIGRINMQSVQEPQVAAAPPQSPQGLEIEVRASRSRPVDIQATVSAATAAIQTSLGIPLHVNVHQVDDTKAIDRRWAQEVVAMALRS